jgi:hypothetical protein
MNAYVMKVLFQFELGVLCHYNICHQGPCHLAYVTQVYNITTFVVISINFFPTLCVLLATTHRVEFWCFIEVFFIFLDAFLNLFHLFFSSYHLFILHLLNVVNFFEYSKFVIFNSNVWNSTFLLPWRCWMHMSTYMHCKIKTRMFEQLSKPFKMDGILISLLDVVCLISMQNVVARNRGKMITHWFWFKNLSLDEEIQHCCHCLQLWFQSWNVLFSSIMCTWRKMCLKKIWV